MKKEFAGRFAVWACIFDGHSHIERRVYIDDMEKRYVKINGMFFELKELPDDWEVDIVF